MTARPQSTAHHTLWTRGPSSPIETSAIWATNELKLSTTATPRARPPSLTGANSAARTLAHEVRNPLAGIRAAAQLIAALPTGSQEILPALPMLRRALDAPMSAVQLTMSALNPGGGPQNSTATR